MRGMDLHFEVIRDREAIYQELLHSQSTGHQLAICYKMDDILTVKICIVTCIVRGNSGVVVHLRSEPGDSSTEIVLALGRIESIYPIHAFRK